MEEMRRDLNSLPSRLDKLESEVSELKDSVKRALDNILPKVEALLANHSSNVSNSFVVERPAANAESSVSLFQAAEDGDVEAIFGLFSRDDIDIKQRNEVGDSALHVAAKAGHELAVIVLLGNIPVELLGRRGRTALHYACAEGRGTVVRRLLDAGAKVDTKDCDGDFALLFATKAGHLPVVELLANHNASLNAVDKHENSALVAAAKMNYWEIVKLLLLRGASAEIYKGDYNAPLYLVSKGKNYPLLTTVLNNIKKKERQIRLALTKCNDARLAFVFEDAVPGFCRTEEGHLAMTAIIMDGKVDVLEAMLDISADLFSTLCLRQAAMHGNVTIVNFLLRRGAPVDYPPNEDTPLHKAAMVGHVAVVRLLLAAGASVYIKNYDNKTPLDVAKTDEIRQILTSHSSQS